MNKAIYLGVFLTLFFLSQKSIFAQEAAILVVPQKSKLSQPEETLQESKVSKPKKPRVIFLDIPLLPFEKSVDITRIKERTVYLGSFLEPWEEKIPVAWPNLDINFEGYDFAANISGGISYFDDGINIRKNKSLEFSGEESVWKILFGGQGFVEHEKVPSVISGLKFQADYVRLSYGARSWSGIKFGDFNDRYLLFKIGGGYIWTKSEETYRASFKELESLPLYDEEYKNLFFAVEGRIDFLKHFSYRSRAEKNFYEKVYKFKDIGMYGINSFNDLTVENSLEVVPVLRVDRVRVLLRSHLNLDNEDRLLFRNSPISFQILLRLRLK